MNWLKALEVAGPHRDPAKATCNFASSFARSPEGREVSRF